MKELHPVEFIDLIQPNEEKYSSDIKEVIENQKQKLCIKKLCVKSRTVPQG